MTTIRASSEVLGGEAREFDLELLDDRVSARELLRSHVYQHVGEHNARQRLAGERGELDWNSEFERVLQHFGRGQVLVLVAGRQLVDLDEKVSIPSGQSVRFLRLVPLVGG